VKVSKWTTRMLLARFPDLSAVVDLTNTNRYYEWQRMAAADLRASTGVQYVKVATQGHVVPDQGTVRR